MFLSVSVAVARAEKVVSAIWCAESEMRVQV
jgi:hypothetical protein